MGLQKKRRTFASKDQTRVNGAIRAPEVRAVDVNGEQLGVLPVSKAIEKAKERGYDLVEVAPQAKPPVCRIMDYGKYKYEQSKKAKASKAKQHVIKIKEIKFHPKTGENDYQYRYVRAREFLEKGFKVKATVVFRGREMTHVDYGSRWLKRMAEDLKDIAVTESNNSMEGRNLTTIFAPLKPQGKTKKVPTESEKAQEKTENQVSKAG